MMEMRHNEDLYPALFDAIATGGFEEIAKAAHAFIGHPIVLIDVAYKVVVQVPQLPIGDLVWDTLLKEKLVPSQMVWNFDRDEYVKFNRETDRAFFVDWGMVSGLPRIMASVRVDDAIAGFMGILYPEGTCTPDDLAAADLLAKAFSIQFRQVRGFAAEIHPLRNVFLSELFQGSIRTREELKEWESHTNLRLPKGYRLLSIQPRGTAMDQTLLQYIQSQLERRLSAPCSIVVEESIIMLLSGVKCQKDADPSALEEMRLVEHVLKEHSLQCGISDWFDDLLDIHPYLYQARQALAIGKSGPEAFTVAAYPRLVLTDIFSKVRKSMDERNYLHPALPILSAQDAEYGTEYMDTLRTYMTSMCNSNRTSRQLSIHRNTLLYRLNRIVELTGVDFEDQDTCTHLLISFYLS